jgi:hypothetical protein
MPYWTKLLQLNHALANPALDAQVQAMSAWRDALAKRQLPKHPLPRLGIDESLYLDLVMAGRDVKTIQTMNKMLRNFRQYFAYHFGMWSSVNLDLFRTWHSLFGRMRYLEVASGNGYLSAGLKAQGNQVITTDALTWTQENMTGRTPLVKTEALTANAALWAYGDQVDAVVMAWSPDRDINDAHTLHLMRRQFPQLLWFVIGERNGATDSRLFWSLARIQADRRLLKLNRQLPQFDAINERIYLIQ